MSFLQNKWLLLGATSIVVGSFLLFGQKGLMQLELQEAQLRHYQQEIHRLLKKNTSLQQEIDQLQHDQFAVEKVAREELYLVKADEVVYYFNENGNGNGNGINNGGSVNSPTNSNETAPKTEKAKNHQ
jgi:cell division protein FtsB